MCVVCQERRLGPGSYDAAGHGDFSKRSVAERAKGPGWQRAQETARLAAIPHLLYREAWENKRFLVGHTHMHACVHTHTPDP